MATALIDAPRADGSIPVDALNDLLDDLAGVLMAVNLDTFVARPESGVSGSVGEHVRHLLDHVAAFLEWGGLAPLDYDRRQRGTRVETDPLEALAHLLRLQRGLERMALRHQQEHVRVRTQLTTDGSPMTSWSTLGRELAFVVSHTIHHQALIALLLSASQSGTLPARFGSAPSTPLARS